MNLLRGLRAGLAFGAIAFTSLTAAQTPTCPAGQTAHAVLQPQGAPAWEQAVCLSHRWDTGPTAGRAGRARYTLPLPAPRDDAPQALLLTRVGNQAVVRVNGQEVARYGELGAPGFDAAKAPHLITLPPGLLRTTGAANELQVDVTAQAHRWGGLARVQFGPLQEMNAAYRWQRLWRQDLALAFGGVMALFGLLTAALWWRQREPLYGLFAAAALLGVVRHLDRVWPDVPAPWPWWGAVVAAAYGVHLVLICRFSVLAVGTAPRPLLRWLDATAVLAVVLAFLSFFGLGPKAWTAAMLAMVPPALWCLALVSKRAWSSRARLPLAVLVASAVAAGAALHDLGMVRLGASAGGSFSVLPYALGLYVLVMGAVVVERFTRSVQEARSLNATLLQRVAAREQQLHQAFETLQQERSEQARLQERARMMREIHDGVGAQLVGLLNLLESGQADRVQLQEQVSGALDEMRMAVDAMQPLNGDITAVLATLRYRLQPRLQAAGVQLDWAMENLAPVPGLEPQVALQLQRILLEGFTNILRHARATRISVQARWQQSPQPGIELLLNDNGVGLPPPAPGQPSGQGLLNMRERAAQIGAELTLRNRPEGGVQLRVWWPQLTPAPGA